MNCQNAIHVCKFGNVCQFVGREQDCPKHSLDCGGANTPTFGQWFDLYSKAANDRHAKVGTLSSNLVRQILAELNRFKTTMGYTDADSVGVINRKTLTEYCNRMTCKGVSKISKCQMIRQAFAKWARIAFDDVWDLPIFDLPEIADDSERYREPSVEMRLSVAKWYRLLYGRGRGKYRNRDRLFAMMMYKYAMRNGDVERLKWSDIKLVQGKPRLVYQPHKTRLSSKRFVRVYIDAMDYNDLLEYKDNTNAADDDFIFGGGHCIELRKRLNRELRALGFTGSKGMYELRKLCVHSVFKKLGREAASAISGDDFETIKFHYADPDSISVSALSDDEYI